MIGPTPTGTSFDIRPRAAGYLADGLDAVPLEPRGKAIKVPEWQTRAFNLDDFKPANNVGLRLGKDGLADVDLDCPEALAIAHGFLPETGFVFGRASARASHHFYKLIPAVASVERKDPITGDMLIELRCLTHDGAIGRQTVAPGSIHAGTGEPIDFEPGVSRMIQNVDADEVVEAVNRIAAAALLVRYWPAKGRHDTMLALAGVLAKSGWLEVQALEFCRAVYRAVPTHDRAAVGRVKTEVSSTYKAMAEGVPFTGIPKLKEAIDKRVVDAVLKWLGISLPEQAPAASDSAIVTDRMCNDTGNADRLVEAHGADLMYCEQRECFAVWTGSHWKLDRSMIVSRMAEKVMLKAFEETALFSDKEARAAFFKFVNRSLQRAGIANMVEVAKRKVREIGAADFDGDPFLLNFTNGTLDLRTGILREARREDLISKCIPYAFDANAECPTYEAFLKRITGGGPGAMQAERTNSEARIGYLQRISGCAITGKPEKLLFIFHGGGNNGKTTFLETIRAAVGDEQYAGQLQIESLMAKHADAAGSNAINADLAGLQGCRFVTASEPEEGMKFSVSRLKYILGLSKIKARYLRENPFEFKPSHKLFVDCNHRPVITDPNDAIWNRVQLFPFDVEIPRSEIDTELPAKLRRELPGIMAWLARGAMDYIKFGIEKIPEVAAATEEYREDSDSLREFFEDRCRIAPTDRAVWVSKSDLWNSYVAWAAANSIKFPMGKAKFEERIQRLGCREMKKNDGSIRAWQGISLNP